jgi:oligopeptide transport system substrate-binding protein
MATVWREQLGAEIVLESFDWDTYIEQTLVDAPQVFRLGWCADYIDPDNFLVPKFHSTGENNDTNFANVEFDGLVEQAAATNSPATRQIYYIQAERILCEQEAAVIPLYHFISK